MRNSSTSARQAALPTLIGVLVVAVLALCGCAVPSASGVPITPPPSEPEPTASAPVAAPPASLGADGVLRDVDYVGAGNRAQTLDLYWPTNRSNDGPVPLVLFVHGGGWSQGSKAALEDEQAGGIVRLVELLRANGYAVAGVNYRLSGEATWPAPLFDLKSATRHLREHADQYGLDATRFAVAGESAGGQLAMMLGLSSNVADLQGPPNATTTSTRMSAIISYYGVTDLRTLAAERHQHNCPPQSMPGAPTLEGIMLGAEPRTTEGALLAAKASPISYASAEAPPMLLLHGTADCTVLDVQSISMHAALRAAGGESRLLLNDANHAWPVFYTDPVMQRAVLDVLARAFGR